MKTKDEVKQASLEDFKKQTTYNDACDRQKGFIAGAEWMQSQLQPLIEAQDKLIENMFYHCEFYFSDEYEKAVELKQRIEEARK